MLKVIVLISGRGSNLKSLIEQAEHYQIVNVISDLVILASTFSNAPCLSLEFLHCHQVLCWVVVVLEIALLLQWLV